ncbi:MAG: PIN domain nuclease [Chloroflexota bacterium]|nr:PIN domain nuclease [Chloroflexota bacterium]
MSIDFIFRMVGMVVCALIGARFGLDSSPAVGLPPEAASLLFALIGVLFGLIITPYVTLRPIRLVSRVINGMAVEVVFMAIIGMLLGLLLGLLLAYPLSLLQPPLGGLLPPIVSVVFAYLGLTLFTVRSREFWAFLTDWLGIGRRRAFAGADIERQLLLDTSVLIDGRIVDIAKTGFMGGTLVVPRFVVQELQRVADSSDAQRRNRGRRGVDKLKELQREPAISFKIVDDDIEGTDEVDDKLIQLSLKINAPIVTIDFPLNRVAEAQGATVLNINLLANAVRSVYIPGETFALRIIQDGKEMGQGVGYLEDGTMVIVENGRQYMDRSIYVTVTKLINKETGRIIFATPEQSAPRA